ncbi:hypothetical protein ACFQ2M_22225 [Kitasatospora saccharophila]|uniref:hypothetical protein n=1 Tax=Kitasatospora saccharophila TaxID=407973 RepID=UPI00362652D1
MRRKFAAVPLATAATALVLLFSVVQHLPGGDRFVSDIGVVKAALPLDVSLLRTPLSLYVPALDLPVWGRWRRCSWCSGSPRWCWGGG